MLTPIAGLATSFGKSETSSVHNFLLSKLPLFGGGIWWRFLSFDSCGENTGGGKSVIGGWAKFDKTDPPSGTGAILNVNYIVVEQYLIVWVLKYLLDSDIVKRYWVKFDG